MEIPAPICPLGYPDSQIREIIGEDRMDNFGEWMYGNTCAKCDSSTQSCNGNHGLVTYADDFHRFMRGLPSADEPGALTYELTTVTKTVPAVTIEGATFEATDLVALCEATYRHAVDIRIPQTETDLFARDLAQPNGFGEVYASDKLRHIMRDLGLV